MEVDPSRKPIVPDYGDIGMLYFIRCSVCKAQLGALWDVSSTHMTLTQEELKLEHDYRNRPH